MQLSTKPIADQAWVEETFATFLSNFLVLVGASLLAVQIRLQVPFGNFLPPNYVAQPFLLYPLLACAALATSLLIQTPLALRAPLSIFLSKGHPFRRYLVSLGLASFGVLIALPDVSQLQIVYFAVVGFILGVFCIAIPFRLYVGHPGNSIIEPLRNLWRRRALLSLWVRFNIEARYSQRILGILWIVLLPIATAFVYAIAFSQFMFIQLDVPFIAFYMAATIPFRMFADSILNSTDAIKGGMTIIGQVYFPREILVLVTLGEIVVDFCFAFVSMTIINLFVGIVPNIYFLYLPLLFAILVAITLGLMFIVSILAMMVRDIPPLVAVFMQLFFFLTPIIYPIEHFPERFRFLFIINPIAPIIQGFRDIIVYGRPPDIVSLYYSIVFAGVALAVGFSTFKSFETDMADYV